MMSIFFFLLFVALILACVIKFTAMFLGHLILFFLRLAFWAIIIFMIILLLLMLF